MVLIRLMVVWLVAISVMHALLILVAVVHMEVGVVVQLVPPVTLAFNRPVLTHVYRYIHTGPKSHVGRDRLRT